MELFFATYPEYIYLVAATGLACTFSAPFLLAEKYFNDPTKTDFKRAVERTTALQRMGVIFDKVFTSEPLSWRFFSRSCSPSLC